MTLLVGIYCKEGVVIAADRQATHGAVGIAPTVGQPVTKVQILSSKAKGKNDVDHYMLFAASGPNGLGQQLASAVETQVNSVRNIPYAAACINLQKQIRSVLDPAFNTAGLAQRVIGGAAATDALCGSLIAMHCSDGHLLMEVSPQGGCERMTLELPFVCVGSGKQNADPLLRLFWSMFFAESAPSLKEATLAAYWTVQKVIDLKTPGVGFEPDVFVLERSKKEFIARRLDGAELQGHQEFAEAIATAVRAVRDQLAATPPTAPSEPPTLAAVAVDGANVAGSAATA